LPSLPELRAAAGGALVEVATSEIADDWSERWREFHQPAVIGEALTVRAPWHGPASTPLEIVIDPGQAFGTGAHTTTRQCLELMLALCPKGAFLDLGCGSGVLAIAAGRLGFEPVLALDNDPAAVEATSQNARVNDVEVQVERIDLRTDPAPAIPTVAANLLASLLIQWTRSLTPVTKRVIASGVLADEADRVADAFAAAGLDERTRLEDAGWTTLLLIRDR
jgi:ribosomal protein L11 methyltransferase